MPPSPRKVLEVVILMSHSSRKVLEVVNKGWTVKSFLGEAVADATEGVEKVASILGYFKI
jgi:DNA-binding MltR family transcriptional regulator